MNEDKRLTVAQVAQALGVSACRVRQLITLGRLPAGKFGAAYFVLASTLTEYQNRKLTP